MAENVVEKYLSAKNKSVKDLTIVAGIIGTVLVLISAYNFVMQNIYVPSVEILSVDYLNAKSVVKIGGKEKILSGNGTLYIGNNWGIRFGTITLSSQLHYDAIELIKNGMVYKTLALREDHSPVV